MGSASKNNLIHISIHKLSISKEVKSNLKIET
jgi:hypothetical protein